MSQSDPQNRSLRELIRGLMRWMRRVATQPREELDRWQRAARFAYDLSRHGGRQLRHDRAPQMAGALAFRTLFALLPVLIVSMVVVKAVSGTDAFLVLTRELFRSMRLNEVSVVPAGSGAAGTAQESISLAEWLQELIKQAAGFDMSAVGWVGVAVIAYAAIGLIVTIEDSFNTIYRAPEGRPWTRRIPLYWFILTMSPVALGISWYLNRSVTDWIQAVDSWHTLWAIAGLMWSLLAGWIVMFAIYMLVPNTAVAIRPVLAGAFVATLLLEIGKRTLDAYLQNAFAISQLYGSLGLIPLFMFWVYLMWLAVLFGLEVAATLQMLGGRRLETIQPHSATTGLIDPATVVTAMEVIAERFAAGRSTTARQVAEAGSLPENAVAVMIDRLVEEGLLHRVDGDLGAVTLARPPDQVSVQQLIDIGFRIVDQGRLGRPSELVKRLREAQRQLAARTTLAALVSPVP